MFGYQYDDLKGVLQDHGLIWSVQNETMSKVGQIADIIWMLSVIFWPMFQSGYEMWREPYKGPKPYLEFEAHYVCNCKICLPYAYEGLILDPLTNIVYQKLKENLTVNHKNNTYEHIHHQLNMATRKHVALNQEINNLKEKLKKYES